MTESHLEFSTFKTSLGWMGIVGRNNLLAALFFGDASRGELETRMYSRFDKEALVIDADWNVDLRELLEGYATGEQVDFSKVAIDLQHRTPFQQRVLAATRRIPFGTTATYGEIALQAGSERAARAVGSTMAGNDWPLIIPCHRVVGASGKLTGFTSPQGIRMKERLLQMESATIGGIRNAASNSRVATQAVN